MYFGQRSHLDPQSEYPVMVWLLAALLLIGAGVAWFFAWGAPPEKAAVAAQLRMVGWVCAGLGLGLAGLIMMLRKLLDW